MHKIITKRKIKAPCEKVRRVLWDVKSWSQFWSPLHKVDILYDDGSHQDFAMFLEWQKEDTSIRTVRFLDDQGNITFFSPQPPPPMAVHQGVWQLDLSDGNGTDLTAIRWFKLPYLMKETPGEYQQRIMQFSIGFEERLTNLLKSLGGLCEKLM